MLAPADIVREGRVSEAGEAGYAFLLAASLVAVALAALAEGLASGGLRRVWRARRETSI